VVYQSYSFLVFQKKLFLPNHCRRAYRSAKLRYAKNYGLRFSMGIRSNPNRGPAIVLGITSLVTVGAIFYSHYSQIRDKQVMREGIQRDKERIRLKLKLKQESDK
jgi:hypothetical protein